jgi:serine phosphatase RsbU (regulator of sigma subunit)
LGATPTLCNGKLAIGDRLLLFTDGLLEARGADGEFVDLAQLVAPVTEADFDEVLDGVLEGLLSAIGGALTDDLALLAAEFRGVPKQDAKLASDPAEA